MSLPSNTITVSNASLLDPHAVSALVANVDPSETPLLASMKKTKASSGAYHEWQVNEFSDYTDNAQVAGMPVTGFDAGQPGHLERNFIQEATKQINITKQALASPNYSGTLNRYAQELVDKSTSMKLGAEYSLLVNHAPVDASVDSTLAGKVRGFQNIIRTNASNGATGADAVDNTSARTAGTLRALTDTLVNDTAEAVYNSSGEADTIVTSTSCVGVITKFESTGKNYSTKLGEKGDFITIYQTNFGTFKIIKPRTLAKVASEEDGGHMVLILNTDRLKLAESIPMQTQELAVTGTAKSTQLFWAYTLEYQGEKAHGAIWDIDPAL